MVRLFCLRPIRYIYQMKILINMRLCMLLVAAAVVSFSSCGNDSQLSAKAEGSIPDTLIKGNFNEASGIHFDSTAIDTFLKARPELASYAEDFRTFYRMRDYAFVWYDGKRVTESTQNMIGTLQNQQSDGVLKPLPYQLEFNKLINKLGDGSQEPDLRTELMLTGQYFNYAHNVWGGAEADKATKMGWYLPRKKLSYSQLLDRQLTLTKDSVLSAAVVPQYLALKKVMNAYQQTEKKDSDVFVPYIKQYSAIKPGDTAAVLTTLRARLLQLGDLQTASATNVYDDDLQTAVKRFKERHGISINTQLNQAMFKQLNVPIHKRIQTMLINLERMRWVPADDHGGEYILVNIPEYMLHYYVENKLNWDCKVVVGKSMNKTVVFSGHLQYLVFNPYWYIPQSIIAKEVKPGMARNGNYLAKHRMEWNGGNVRQRPGPENSLGLVKFIFPNDNNIYLHDTPSKSLFNEDDRAFSHGCIRVAQPAELAFKLLGHDPAWTPEKIKAAMNGGRERKVTLKNKTPVYIGYFTAFVNSKGLLNFREDIYGRDPALLKLLMKD